jgi:glycosyltransferase involved in cell wall biosynthesis
MAVCCLDHAGLWAPKVASLGVPVSSFERAPGFRPGIALRLASLARSVGAGLLHCHHYSPFVYGRLAASLVPGVHVVFTEHGRLSDAPPSSKRRWANRALMTGSLDVCAVSHDLRAHMIREGAPSTLEVIWNGIEAGLQPTHQDRSLSRHQLGADAGDWVVGTVARLDPVKDLALLLTAFLAVHRAEPRAKLVVIGDGPERRALGDHAEALGIGHRVSWLGYREDARALATGFDVYGNSSASEGISLTILEAMAAERPVVATRVGGTPEVVVHGTTGLLVERHAAALEEALLALSRDPARADSMGREGRLRVKTHFSLETMVGRYERLYRRRLQPG